MGIKGHLTLNTQLLLLLLLLSHFSRVQLCATPQTAAHQAPPSLGFSRQEHWSGVPFPSPMHESGKGKWSHSVVSYSLRPHALQPTRLLCPWDFSGKSTRVGCHCLLRSTQQTASIFFYEILRKATWWIRFKYNLMTISQNHWQWESIVKKTEIIVILHSSVQFCRSVMSNSLRPHESQHARPPCPPPTPGVYSNSCPSSP